MHPKDTSGMTVRVDRRLGTHVRYLSIGLACWVIGSLALFASQKAQLVGRLEGGLFANAVILSTVCWVTVFPSQILCCSAIRIRDAMLARESPI